MSSVYAPRRTLCVPDNACSLAMTSIEMVVGISDGEKLFNSGLMVRSENVDVKEEFTLASIVFPNQLDVFSYLERNLTCLALLQDNFFCINVNEKRKWD